MKPEISINEVAGRTCTGIHIGNNGQAIIVFADAFTTLGVIQRYDEDAKIEDDKLDVEDFGFVWLAASGIMTEEEAKEAIFAAQARRQAMCEASERFQYERLKAKFEGTGS